MGDNQKLLKSLEDVVEELEQIHQEGRLKEREELERKMADQGVLTIIIGGL